MVDLLEETILFFLLTGIILPYCPTFNTEKKHIFVKESGPYSKGSDFLFLIKESVPYSKGSDSVSRKKKQ